MIAILKSTRTQSTGAGYSLRAVTAALKSLAQELVTRGKGMEALLKAQQLTEIVELIQTRRLTAMNDVWSRIVDAGQDVQIERLLDDNQRGVESLMKESKSLNYFLTKSMSRVHDGIKPTSMSPHKRQRGVGLSRQSRDMMASISEMHMKDSPAAKMLPSLNILQSNAYSWYKQKATIQKEIRKRSYSYESKFGKQQLTKPKARARSYGYDLHKRFSKGYQRQYRHPWDLDYETALRGKDRQVLPWNRLI